MAEYYARRIPHLEKELERAKEALKHHLDALGDCPSVNESGKHNWTAVNGIYNPWLCLSCNRWKNDVDAKV